MYRSPLLLLLSCSIICLNVFNIVNGATHIKRVEAVVSHGDNDEGWITDGTPGLSTEGNVLVNLQKQSTGSPQNGLWTKGGGVSSGRRYWTIELNLVTDHASVGVTSNDKFGQGWKAKGLYYNGNLSNGGALLGGSFGPWLQTGDVVGILVSIEDGKVRVYYDLNKKSLGLAFEVTSDLFSGPLFPSVRFDGSGVAVISEVTPAPKPQPRPTPEYNNTIVGDWKLLPESLKCQTEIPIPPPFRGSAVATLKVAEAKTPTTNAAARVYDVLLRIVNSITFQWKNEERSNKWDTSVQASTLMMGPPENMAIEHCLSDLTNTPTVLVLTNDRNLKIEKGALFAAWQRYDSTPQPFTGNPFH